MGLNKKILIIVAVTLCAVIETHASWQGPSEIISGSWGSDAKQFGIDSGDSGDSFPLIEAITPDSKIVVTDTVNKKQIAYGVDGSFIKEVKWTIKSQSGGRTYYDIAEYSFGPIVGYSSDGNIYTGSGGKYFMKSSSGQLIKTLTTRPAELGIISEKATAENQYRITIKYPDKTYELASSATYMRYVRDSAGYINAVNPGGVWRFNKCGKQIAELLMPQPGTETVPVTGLKVQQLATDVEYGEPVIAPTGDVYTWEKTRFKYSIIKWTWVDDPNVPTGPDAPTGLTLMPSTTGLYLTWTASPSDPGCVTGYEVARATSSGGVFSAVATVDKGVIKYNDTTAAAGTMYYYKVRAKAGSEHSPYSAVVSGKR